MPDYTIKDGDTLTGLAKKFGTTVNELARANGIEDPDKIYIGDRLMVPDQKQAQMKAMVQQLLRQQAGPQMNPAQQPIPQGMMPPQNMTGPNTPMPMGGGSPIPTPQSQALQQSTPEALLGMPGMLKGGLGMAAGGLAGLAKMAPQMARAGRMAPPAGYSNIVPMGNSGPLSSSMAQAMLNSKGGLGHPAANVMRQQRTQTMGSPEHQIQQMMQNQRYPLNPGVRHTIGQGANNPEAAMLEEMIMRRRMGQ